MLTSDGNKLLRDLPLCKTIIDLLVIDACKEMDVFVIDILSVMDSDIIKVSECMCVCVCVCVCVLLIIIF